MKNALKRPNSPYTGEPTARAGSLNGKSLYGTNESFFLKAYISFYLAVFLNLNALRDAAGAMAAAKQNARRELA